MRGARYPGAGGDRELTPYATLRRSWCLAARGWPTRSASAGLPRESKNTPYDACVGRYTADRCPVPCPKDPHRRELGAPPEACVVHDVAAIAGTYMHADNRTPLKMCPREAACGRDIRVANPELCQSRPACLDRRQRCVEAVVKHDYLRFNAPLAGWADMSRRLILA